MTVVFDLDDWYRDPPLTRDIFSVAERSACCPGQTSSALGNGLSNAVQNRPWPSKGSVSRTSRNWVKISGPPPLVHIPPRHCFVLQWPVRDSVTHGFTRKPIAWPYAYLATFTETLRAACSSRNGWPTSMVTDGFDKRDGEN